MSFTARADAAPVLRDKPNHPKGWEPGYEWDGSSGHILTGPLGERPTTWDAYLIDAGLNPDEVEVIEPVQVRGWDAIQTQKPAPGMKESAVVRMHYYRLNVRRRTFNNLPDLRELFKSARTARKQTKTPPLHVESATAVLWADPQTGKVGSRGGSADLVARVERYLVGMEDYSKQQSNDAGYLFDLGDAIEGFENTAQQQHTNDLSLMDQVDLAATLEWEAVKVLARTHDRVVEAGIGSNHCRWRKGKDPLGSPGADWGIHILKQHAKLVAEMPEKYGHVSVRWPNEWEETISLDVAGLVVGLSHGHQVNRPEQIPDWWAKQTHGGQSIAHADLLLTGHFHHLRVQPTGRNPWSNRSKWWIQAPSMDNGSDWYRATSGSDSDPGLVLLTITKDGWHDLVIL